MPEIDRLRIMVVDDSSVTRSLLRAVIMTDVALEVVATAADGASALACLESTRPDLILLDVEMPLMDGLATLRELRERGHRMPVIMCSSLTQRGAKVTIESLSAGASDYVSKPAGQSSREDAIRILSQELLPKIHALAVKPPATAQTVPATIPLVGPRPTLPVLPIASGGSSHSPAQITAQPAVLVVGTSTGGPAALDQLLPLLPADFPLPVLIVQHMPEVFTHLFAQRLNGLCPLRVHEAVEGEPIVPGAIFIARGDRHLEAMLPKLRGGPPTLHLSAGLPENYCRPSVDVLFRSAAHVYGAGVLAVVLTGMGTDGLNGCRVIRDNGGSVLAQDEASSVVWGMPRAVATAGLAHKVLSLDAMAAEILRLIRPRVLTGEFQGTQQTPAAASVLHE